MTHDDTSVQPRDAALRDRPERRTRTLDVGGPRPKRVLDQVSVAAVVLDKKLRVVRYNGAAERLFRRPFQDVLGKRCEDALPALAEITAGLCTNILNTGEPAAIADVRVKTADSARYYDLVLDPTRSDRGKVAGVSIVAVDVTERVRLKERLAEQNEDLAALQKVSNALRRTMDLDKAFFIVASALTSDEGGGYDHAMIFTVDQDRENLVGRVCVDSLGLPDIWGIWRGLTSVDAPLRKTLESTQPVLARRWGELSDRVRAVSIPLDDETSILTHAVRTGETVTHETLRDWPGLRLHPAIRELIPFERFAAAPLLAEREAIGVIVVDATKHGKALSPERLMTLEMFADHAALAINNGLMFQDVLDRAQKDSLTRLYNHGHFQDVLKREIERATRYRNPLSLVMLDIDHFKNFNDTWGHQTGDRALKQAALLLTALVRGTDLPARYGGEEFALLLPQTDYLDALELAERLRHGMERKVQVAGPRGEKIGLTASLGVASFPRHAEDAAELVMCADAALYLAKERGRNCVFGADDVDDAEGTTERKKSSRRPTERLKEVRKRRGKDNVRVKTPDRTSRREP